MAENQCQIEVFDRSAEVYESQLHGADRRWRRRHVSRAARMRRAKLEIKERVPALATYPESLVCRPFWGRLRKLASNGSGS